MKPVYEEVRLSVNSSAIILSSIVKLMFLLSKSTRECCQYLSLQGYLHNFKELSSLVVPISMGSFGLYVARTSGSSGIKLPTPSTIGTNFS